MVEYGYAGKILRVDLSRRKVDTVEVTRDFALTFIGGKGFGAKLLYDGVEAGVDPLSPENKLIFATGPLTGTLAPSSSKFEVVTKSPLTGIFLNSDCGGFFGSELKYAGYDVLVVEGAAEKPSYLWINDGNVEIRDASHLWGMKIGETFEALKRDLGEKDLKAACIGPAGEKLVKFSNIIATVTRAAGRGGSGAVMGSKKLKAIAVKGSRDLKIYDVTGFVEAVREAYEICKGGALKIVAPLGTPAALPIANDKGVLPIRNFQRDTQPNLGVKLGPETMKKYVFRSIACSGCPARCGKVSVIVRGKYAGTIVEGPDYETLYSLGAVCGVEDFEVVVKANELCDEFGVDTISTGVAIAFLMECFEKGLVSEKDVGLKVSWGSPETLLTLIEKISLREGVGDLLAEGVKRASERLGGEASKYAMHVKGLELPGWEPRALQGTGLGYATSDRGACHMRAQVHPLEAIFGTLDPTSTQGKPEIVKRNQDLMAVLDSLGLCAIPGLGLWRSPDREMEVFSLLLQKLTGLEFTEEILWRAGERIWNLTRMFNVREGLTRKDDTLPERILSEPIVEGPFKGHTCALGEMLDRYYEVRGWDRQGIPTDSKLRELGLR